ncbi:MAG: hypothetical protein M1828_006661 [Chrysothrix sp. TS-e1954]|nr:MAG: hypothetical protein M1828_006661 [Chrysothrix sp. TS-e1954]
MLKQADRREHRVKASTGPSPGPFDVAAVFADSIAIPIDFINGKPAEPPPKNARQRLQVQIDHLKRSHAYTRNRLIAHARHHIAITPPDDTVTDEETRKRHDEELVAMLGSQPKRGITSAELQVKPRVKSSGLPNRGKGAIVPTVGTEAIAYISREINILLKDQDRKYRTKKQELDKAVAEVQERERIGRLKREAWAKGERLPEELKDAERKSVRAQEGDRMEGVTMTSPVSASSTRGSAWAAPKQTPLSPPPPPPPPPLSSTPPPPPPPPSENAEAPKAAALGATNPHLDPRRRNGAQPTKRTG